VGGAFDTTADGTARATGRFWTSWPRFVARTTWHPDKWERLTLMADHVPAGAANVLDVGGRGAEMAGLLAPTPVTSVNVREPADVVVPVGDLPFGDDEFDVVTSCDVLEHMPAERRAEHVGELVRVARRRLVLCCPYGSDEKNEAEREIADTVMRELGRTFPYLDEHVAYGFPSEDEVVSMVRSATPGGGVRSLYYGDYPSGNAMLLDGVRARYGHDVKSLVRFVGNAYVRPRRPRLEITAGPTTARLYVIADLPA
jgi:Methyltransferase domain